MPHCIPRPKVREFYHHKPGAIRREIPDWALHHARIAGPHEVFIVQHNHRIEVLQPEDFHRDFIAPVVQNMIHGLRYDARALTEMES